MRSMTGFGRGKCNENGMLLTSTIRTLNHRHCQIKIKIPPEIYELETFIRNILKKRLARGTLEVIVKLEYHLNNINRLDIDELLAREYISKLKELKSVGDIDGIVIDDKLQLESFLQLDSIWSLKPPELDMNTLKEIVSIAMDEALNNVIKMREKEGENLRQVIINILKEFRNILPEIRKFASQQQQIVSDRLKLKLAERFPDIKTNNRRLEEEILYYCEKSNITEELDRLKSHIQAAFEMSQDDGAVGRKFEFLTQEMYREINTLGVKAASAQISTLVIQLKTLVETLKEQIQNIE